MCVVIVPGAVVFEQKAVTHIDHFSFREEAVKSDIDYRFGRYGMGQT